MRGTVGPRRAGSRSAIVVVTDHPLKAERATGRRSAGRGPEFEAENFDLGFEAEPRRGE
jgi:hypothetical protein